MSHDTHEHHHESHNDKPVIQFKAAFYFVMILAGLFVCSIGFVKSMGHDEGHATEEHGGAHKADNHLNADGHNGHGSEVNDKANHDIPAPESNNVPDKESHDEKSEAPAEHH